MTWWKTAYSLSEIALAETTPAGLDAQSSAWSGLERRGAVAVRADRARTGGSAAPAAAYPDLDLQQVQVRLTLRSLPRFEDRGQAVGEPDVDLVFPLVPFQDAAAWSLGR